MTRLILKATFFFVARRVFVSPHSFPRNVTILLWSGLACPTRKAGCSILLREPILSWKAKYSPKSFGALLGLQKEVLVSGEQRQVFFKINNSKIWQAACPTPTSPVHSGVKHSNPVRKRESNFEYVTGFLIWIMDQVKTAALYLLLIHHSSLFIHCIYTIESEAYPNVL